jgi:hypothetical protein
MPRAEGWLIQVPLLANEPDDSLLLSVVWFTLNNYVKEVVVLTAYLCLSLVQNCKSFTVFQYLILMLLSVWLFPVFNIANKIYKYLSYNPRLKFYFFVVGAGVVIAPIFIWTVKLKLICLYCSIFDMWMFWGNCKECLFGGGWTWMNCDDRCLKSTPPKHANFSPFTGEVILFWGTIFV